MYVPEVPVVTATTRPLVDGFSSESGTAMVIDDVAATPAPPAAPLAPPQDFSLAACLSVLRWSPSCCSFRTMACFCHKCPWPSAWRCMQSNCWHVTCNLLHCNQIEIHKWASFVVVILIRWLPAPPQFYHELGVCLRFLFLFSVVKVYGFVCSVRVCVSFMLVICAEKL